MLILNNQSNYVSYDCPLENTIWYLFWTSENIIPTKNHPLWLKFWTVKHDFVTATFILGWRLPPSATFYVRLWLKFELIK